MSNEQNDTAAAQTDASSEPNVVPTDSFLSLSTKRHYTRQDEMQEGNRAILSVLGSTAESALNKKQILSKLTEANKNLVVPNWSLRLAALERTGQVTSVGFKILKKYLLKA